MSRDRLLLSTRRAEPSVLLPCSRSRSRSARNSIARQSARTGTRNLCPFLAPVARSETTSGKERRRGGRMLAGTSVATVTGSTNISPAARGRSSKSSFCRASLLTFRTTTSGSSRTRRGSRSSGGLLRVQFGRSGSAGRCVVFTPLSSSARA